MPKKYLSNRATYEQISREVEYDQLNGHIKRTKGNKAQLGWYPGGLSFDKAHYIVSILGKVYTVADIAWLLMTRQWSSTFVRHRDGNSLNNTWNNLTNLRAKDYPKLTYERANECLEYNVSTGLFRWKNRPWLTKDWFRGNRRVRKEDGYEHFAIQIDGRSYNASRVAFLLMEHRWPADQIDHKDRDGARNNKYENLRPATPTQNQFNRDVRCDNRLGIKGVRKKDNGKFEARIKINKKGYGLGTYNTIEEASQRYEEVARRIHGDFFYKNQ